MQTFMPEPSMALSLQRLDYRRLGKQRVEALQIFNALTGRSVGWSNHPAVRMWQGHEDALMLYHDLAIELWEQRGYKNTMPMFDEELLTMSKEYDGTYDEAERNVRRPPWMFDQAFLDSHRSNLLRKEPDHYRQFNWGVPDDLPYVWPVVD